MIRSTPENQCLTWQNERRDFLKKLGVLMAGSYLTIRCTNQNEEKNIYFSNDEYTLLKAVLLTILPPHKNAPNADDIQADAYFLWYISTSNLPYKTLNFYIKGLENVQTYSQDHYNKPFHSLAPITQNQVLENIQKTKKGKKWLSNMINILMEALFSDELYGNRTNKNTAWEWVNHDPGVPRPENSTQIYPNALEQWKM